jgi:type II secretory pathway pseudopilin PulG
LASEEPRTVIVERSRGSGVTLIALIVAAALIALAAYMLVGRDENRKDNAITTAAEQVGEAAQDVGDAAQEAVNKK